MRPIHITLAAAALALSAGASFAQTTIAPTGGPNSQSNMPPVTGGAQGVQPPNAVPGGITSQGTNAKNYDGTPNTGSVITGNPAADGNKQSIPLSK